jgi:hypothetical protein
MASHPSLTTQSKVLISDVSELTPPIGEGCPQKLAQRQVRERRWTATTLVFILTAQPLACCKRRFPFRVAIL